MVILYTALFCSPTWPTILAIFAESICPAVTPAAVIDAETPTAIDVVAAKKELTNVKAAVLGLVEGITEFLPVSSTCLKTSLVFCDMLTRRGVRAELRIGVMKTSGGVASHAWVEDDMGAMLTDPLAGFLPLPLSRANSLIVSPDGP